MVELFQECYRELPAFQRALELVSEYDGGFYTKEEFVTRILMLNEDAMNWDTLCKNCGVLMDDNYAKHCQIEQLTEDLAHEMNKNHPQWIDGVCTRCDTPANRHGHGYCWIDM